MAIEWRTVYMTFRGYCTHCGSPVGKEIHHDGSCDMEGSEVRLNLLGEAFGEFLRAERAERVVKAAREYIEWEHAETRQELVDAIEWFERGPENG